MIEEAELCEQQRMMLRKINDSVFAMDIAWRSFLYLFGRSRERAEFFSDTSPMMSSLLGNLLWDATITRIRALTDKPKTGRNSNLSVGCLVEFCDSGDRKNFQSKFDALRATCKESREFANKHIAHFDLRTKLDPKSVTITRDQTNEAIEGIWEFLFSFHVDVLDTHLCREVVRPLPDERDFLELLYLGKRSQDTRLKEFQERFLAHDSFNSALPNPRDDLPEWLQFNADQIDN